jgi:hypothetical protein
VKLIQANSEELKPIRKHLAAVHSSYAAAFDALVRRAEEETQD